MLQVKVCEICGDEGWPEQIVTCYQCKTAQEHIYCMKFLLRQPPYIWVCEECRTSKGQVFPRSVEQDLHSNPDCKTDTLITKSNGTPRFETSLSKFFGQQVNADPGVRAVYDCNPVVLGNEEIHSMTHQQVLQTSKEFIGDNWLVCKKEPEEALDTFGIMVEKAAEITPSPSIDELPISSSGHFLLADPQPQSIDVLRSNLDPKDETCNSFPLISHAIWCGSIQIFSLDNSSEFYDGFWAYLSCKVHPKVLEFSKQMPGVILCSSVPYCKVSLEVFQNDMLNIDDIALIFSPGNFQRSREQYESLLQLIAMQDLVLKSCINDVELLIFSSKRLDVKSSGYKLGSFLLGVFRKVKGHLEVPRHPPLLTQSRALAESSSARIKIEQSLSEFKTEPYNHPNVPPGFPGRAADATAGRSIRLSHI